MPNNTDHPAQRRRKKDALQSAVVSILCLGVTGAGLLLLAWLLSVGTGVRVILTVSSLLDLGMIVPVWILLKVRIKEIDGGEEDAASQY